MEIIRRDSDYALRSLLRLAVGGPGFESVSDLAKAEGLPFDGAIIDFDLPEATGLSLARAIRADGDLAYLPIILLTSIAQPLEIGEVSPIGGIRCVNKPILPSELRHNLYSVLEVDDWQGKHAVEDDVRALRILVAEDNPLNRKLLSRMLESLNHNVDCADDGPAALKPCPPVYQGYQLMINVRAKKMKIWYFFRNDFITFSPWRSPKTHCYASANGER